MFPTTWASKRIVFFNFELSARSFAQCSANSAARANGMRPSPPPRDLAGVRRTTPGRSPRHRVTKLLPSSPFTLAAALYRRVREIRNSDSDFDLAPTERRRDSGKNRALLFPCSRGGRSINRALSAVRFPNYEDEKHCLLRV